MEEKAPMGRCIEKEGQGVEDPQQTRKQSDKIMKWEQRLIKLWMQQRSTQQGEGEKMLKMILKSKMYFTNLLTFAHTKVSNNITLQLSQ